MHLLFGLSLVALIGIVSFFRWPSDVTGATAIVNCVTPSDGMVVDRDTLLCTGVYDLGEGIRVEGDALRLDCNGAVLRGRESGQGVTVRGSGTILVDCVIKNFEYGVVITQGSVVAFEGMTFSDNGQDVFRE